MLYKMVPTFRLQIKSRHLRRLYFHLTINTASDVIPPTVHINIFLCALLGVSSNYVAQASLAAAAVLYTFVVVLLVTDFGMAVLERPDGIFDDATLFQGPVLVLKIDVTVVNGTNHALAGALFHGAIWDQPFLCELIDGHYVVVTAHVEVVFFHVVERAAETTSLIFQCRVQC